MAYDHNSCSYAIANQASPFAGGNKDVFTGKLPAVGHIPFLTYVALIAVEMALKLVPGELLNRSWTFRLAGLPLWVWLVSLSSSYKLDLVPHK